MGWRQSFFLFAHMKRFGSSHKFAIRNVSYLNGKQYRHLSPLCARGARRDKNQFVILQIKNLNRFGKKEELQVRGSSFFILQMARTVRFLRLFVQLGVEIFKNLCYNKFASPKGVRIASNGIPSRRIYNFIGGV